MKKLEEFRKNNPAYKDVPDGQLAKGLYDKYYKDKMSVSDFADMLMADEVAEMSKPAPQEEYNILPLGAGIMGAAQGLSFGTADELAGVVGGAASTLQGKGFGQGYRNVMENQQEALQAARRQQPGSMLGGEIAGAVGTGLAGGAKLAGTKLLQGAGLPTAGGLGALSGGAYEYATGYGGSGERLEGVPTAAALGGLGGVAGGAIGRGLSSAINKGRKLFSRPAQQAASVSDDMVGIGGRPLSQTDDIAVLAQKGDQITMPKGAATGDVNLMRLEEAARQGQFGDDLQRQIGQLDERTKADVLNRIQSMVGKTADEGEELLSKGIKQVQGRYKAGKAMQNKLMKARNDAIAKTSVYKDYAQNTLGRQVDDLAKTPDFQVALMRADNAPIKDDIKILKSILNQDSATGVNFKFLQSWRAGLNDYYGKGQQGALASQLSKTYDDWLDNVALSDAIKAGDEDIAQKIFNANKEYSKFKSLYGTDRYAGQNKAIENILTQEELTPVQAVNTLFGKNIQGNAYTAQNLRRLLRGLQGSPKEEAVKQNFRSGLIMRAYEDAQKTGSFKLGQFKNNLIKLKNSEAYKMNLATPEHNAVMEGLINDLGKVVDAQSRRDVYSPSAPAAIRYLSSIFDKAGYVLPSARAVASGLEGAGKAAGSRPAKKTVEKSLQQVLNEAQKVMSDNAAIYGSMSGGTGLSLGIQGEQ